MSGIRFGYEVRQDGRTVGKYDTPDEADIAAAGFRNAAVALGGADVDVRVFTVQYETDSKTLEAFL